MFQHVSNNSGQWGDANVTSAIFHGVMFATIDESLLGVADRLSHEIDPGLELVVNISLVLCTLTRGLLYLASNTTLINVYCVFPISRYVFGFFVFVFC